VVVVICQVVCADECGATTAKVVGEVGWAVHPAGTPIPWRTFVTASQADTVAAPLIVTGGSITATTTFTNTGDSAMIAGTVVLRERFMSAHLGRLGVRRFVAERTPTAHA
jgi:hypothetical protein